MPVYDLKARTKQVAVATVKACDSLPKSYAARVFASQLVRCASSVGANYRAARRSRTNREFISKIRLVVEEADESQYWLELIDECAMLPKLKLKELLQEAGQLTAIFTSSLVTARNKEKRSQAS